MELTQQNESPLTKNQHPRKSKPFWRVFFYAAGYPSLCFLFIFLLVDNIVNPDPPLDQDKTENTFEQIHRLDKRKDDPDGKVKDRVEEKRHWNVNAQNKDAVEQKSNPNLAAAAQGKVSGMHKRDNRHEAGADPDEIKSKFL